MTDKVLITGATGFLGSHIVRHFLEHRCAVTILRRATSTCRRLDEILHRCNAFTIGECTVDEVVAQEKPDAVIHLAVCYGRNGESASQVLESNLLLPVQLADACEKNGVDTFINTDTFLDRHYQSLAAYSLSKKQIVDWLRLSQLNTINLRLEHPYGERDGDGKFIPYIIDELLANRDHIDLTPGEQERDFIYAGDVAEAYWSAFKHGRRKEASFREYDVGSGNTVSLRSLVELLKSLSGNQSTRLDFGALPYREHEIMHSVANIASMKSDFGWQPRTTLAEGLGKTLNFLRKNNVTV